MRLATNRPGQSFQSRGASTLWQHGLGEQSQSSIDSMLCQLTSCAWVEPVFFLRPGGLQCKRSAAVSCRTGQVRTVGIQTQSFKKTAIIGVACPIGASIAPVFGRLPLWRVTGKGHLTSQVDKNNNECTGAPLLQLEGSNRRQVS